MKIEFKKAKETPATTFVDLRVGDLFIVAMARPPLEALGGYNIYIKLKNNTALQINCNSSVPEMDPTFNVVKLNGTLTIDY